MAARPSATVVLPTPPFWLTTANVDHPAHASSPIGPPGRRREEVGFEVDELCRRATKRHGSVGLDVDRWPRAIADASVGARRRSASLATTRISSGPTCSVRRWMIRVTVDSTRSRLGCRHAPRVDAASPISRLFISTASTHCDHAEQEADDDGAVSVEDRVHLPRQQRVQPTRSPGRSSAPRSSSSTTGSSGLFESDGRSRATIGRPSSSEPRVTAVRNENPSSTIATRRIDDRHRRRL